MDIVVQGKKIINCNQRHSLHFRFMIETNYLKEFLFISCLPTNYTARKIGFTLNLILIKVKVKYDHSFDANFDARQMCVKSVIVLPIHLILDKQEGKCDLKFDSTFDARQRRNQICYGFATTFESCQRRGQTCQLL